MALSKSGFYFDTVADAKKMSLSLTGLVLCFNTKNTAATYNKSAFYMSKITEIIEMNNAARLVLLLLFRQHYITVVIFVKKLFQSSFF